VLAFGKQVQRRVVMIFCLRIRHTCELDSSRSEAAFLATLYST
jgi:hypothetical protein